MKSPMLLWRVLAEEYGEWCRVSTSRDMVTCQRRVKDEGLSFLTITLPAMAADFEAALAAGKIEHDHFLGFKRNGSLPRFLGGFFAQVFDSRSGVLLDQPSVDAIRAIRQICRFCSKINLPCSQERIDRAFSEFVRVEQELEAANEAISQASRLELLRVSRLLFGRTLSHLDSKVAGNELRPKHGGGKTADRLDGNAKWNQHEWPSRLENGGFTSVDYLLPNPRFYQNLERVRFLDPGQERPVKVTQVPKTLKTPRIIAVEPTAMQYAQQAVARDLVKELECDDIARHFVGFTDQEPNQLLAKRGSLSQELATLDLSEASDRVLNSLVQDLLHGYTHLSEAVQACRSTTANVPGHGVIPLVKYASMGSALTFPIEAMMFTTIVFIGIARAQGTKMTLETILSLKGQVRVYGDDIICPVEYAESVIESLESFGFKVNSRKSFWTGKFRESCGRDYYDGESVTTLKLRSLLPESRRDVKEIVSTVSLRNQLFKAGSVKAVQYLDDLLERILGDFPYVGETSPLLGRIGYGCPVNGSVVLHRDTHTPVTRGWVVVSQPPRNGLDGEGALLKFFLKEDPERVNPDEKHLERSGRPRAVNIMRVMAPVH
jgi:hypothetical protein